MANYIDILIMLCSVYLLREEEEEEEDDELRPSPKIPSTIAIRSSMAPRQLQLQFHSPPKGSGSSTPPNRTQQQQQQEQDQEQQARMTPLKSVGGVTTTWTTVSSCSTITCSSLSKRSHPNFLGGVVRRLQDDIEQERKERKEDGKKEMETVTSTVSAMATALGPKTKKRRRH